MFKLCHDLKNVRNQLFFNPHALDRFTPSRARCVENWGSALKKVP